MDEFLGLSPDLLKKLRETLSRCHVFQSEASLRSLFADSRIQLWSGRLSFSPENKQEFINRTISDFSYLEHTHFRKNGLVLLLEVLTDQESKWDTQYRKLKELVAEVQQELLKKRVGGLFGSNSNYESIWQALSLKSTILGCKVAETMPIIVSYIEVSHKKSPKLDLLLIQRLPAARSQSCFS